MTTCELQSKSEAANHGPSTSWLETTLAAVRLWHDRRKALAWLSNLDDYLLRDLGVDPEDVRLALDGRKTRLWDSLSRWRSGEMPSAADCRSTIRFRP